MYSSSFWKATFERAAKTFAQALLAVFMVGKITVLTVDWQQAGAVAATAALISVLTSVASSGLGNTGPSLASEELVSAPQFNTGDGV